MKKYNEYLLDIITEKVSVDETVLIISDRLMNIIKDINHPIKNALVTQSYDLSKNFTITLLDVNDKNDSTGKPVLDSISYMTATKAVEFILKNDERFNVEGNLVLTTDDINYIQRLLLKTDSKSNLFNNRLRAETSFGRLIRKLFPSKFRDSGAPGEDIESFINLYKSIRDTGNFELVEGEFIAYWYNSEQYAESEGGDTLHNSCMRHASKSEYLDFYVLNPDKISLLILKDSQDNTKIRGRAIVWKLDSPEDRIYMDRIYTIYDSDVILFKEYATKNAWLYKQRQDYNDDTLIVDSVTGEPLDDNCITVNDLDNPGQGHFPFVDTLCFFDGSSASNEKDQLDDDDLMQLQQTNGEAEMLNGNREWSDYYNEYIDTDDDDYHYCDWGDGYRLDDDCYYSDFYGETIANDYAESNLYDCSEHCDSSYDYYRKDRDCVELSNGEYADKDYAENNYYYSEYSNEWCTEASYSNHHETYIDDDDVVEVYIDAQQNDTDYRADDDDTWFTWEHDGEKYDNEVTIDELEIENGLKEEEEEEEEEDEDEIKKKELLKKKLLKKKKLKKIKTPITNTDLEAPIIKSDL